MLETFCVARALAELLDAVLPTTCICCGTLGPHICLKCRSNYSPQNLQITRGDLSGVAVLELSEPVHKLLRAIKDEGRTAALAEIAVPMSRAIANRFVAPHSEHIAHQLVAMPTTRTSLRTRGLDLNQTLVRRIARQTKLPAIRGLRFIQQPANQRGLDQAARFENLNGTMSFEAASANAPIILIDDVLTTGATIIEAARAIRIAGCEIAGFCVFAETRKLQDAKNKK